MTGVIDNERFRKLLRSLPTKAIEFLYDQYHHSLVRIAENLTHDLKASEDIVQDTFVHVWLSHRKLSQYHEGSIQHYLVRVVKNKAISHFKRTNVVREQKFNFLKSQGAAAWDHPVEKRIIQFETSQHIRQLIDTFPRRERECLLMRIDEEMTPEQMAERMQITRKAIERSLTSAKKRLQRFWLARK